MRSPALLPVLLLMGFFAVMPRHCEAQLINDNRMAVWPSLGIQKGFGEHWKIMFEHSTRMKFQPFMLDESYLQAGVEYSFRYNISVEFNYRFSECYSTERYFVPEHRLSLEPDFSTNLKRWGFALRPAVQATFGRDYIRKNINPEWCLRPRVTVDYNLRKTSLKPFVSLELFIGQQPEAQFGLYKYRLSLGVSYKLTKKLRIEGYLREQGGFDSNTNSYSILGVDLSWRFK